jgi:L-lactate dehydrogenase
MLTNNSPVKIAIVGGGFVGASTAFAMTMAGIAAEIVVIDTNREKARGEAMDISHGLSVVQQQIIRDGGYEDVKDADVIVITAGSARKPGETRLDLAKKNINIARAIIKSIMEHYNGGIILVVSNPVDILTSVICKESGLPASKVFGSGTSLDTSRFKHLISKSYNVDVTDVNGFIIGEHGDSMVPVWSHTNISGIPLEQYEKMTARKLDKKYIEDETKTSGAQVIQLKGATYYAIAMSITHIVEAIVRDQQTIVSVGSVLSGQYGISDVALSLPCIIGANGIHQVLELELPENERAGFIASANKIKDVLSQTV